MSARTEARLWWIQRLTAMALALFVAAHLVTIVYAVRGGLHADEILARTRGSALWAGFYGAFVLAAAAHGAIGLRSVAIEWLRVPKGVAFALMLGAAAILAVMGLYAVGAVVRT